MKKMKKVLPMMITAGLILENTVTSFACTGIYVGNSVSANGSTYMGRSEDIGDLYGKIYGKTPAMDWPKGAVYEDAYGFSMPYPSHTYAYTYVKDTPEYEETIMDENGNPIGEAYAEAGQNEMGVSVSATVSTYYSKAAEAADPLLDTGICEISIGSVILGGAATAREGVELLAGIIDTYGAGECNSIMISDAKETWYMEIVSGHQYAAIKMPADKVSVQPNIMLLGVIDVTDTENVIVSKDLVSLAKENDFLITDEAGNIDVAKSYAKETSGMGQYSRYWQGLFYVNKEAAAALDYKTLHNKTNSADLFITPTYQLTTMDVLNLLSYRGEGSAYNSNEDSSIYAIGNNRQAECHVFETRPDMPTALSTLQWQAMADAEFSIYLPYYSALVTEVHESYAETSGEFTEGSLNWNFQMINHLCYGNRETCAEHVAAYFEAYQESLVAQQAAIDEQMLKIYAYDQTLASEKATALGKDLAEQVFEMSTSVLHELQAYLEAEDFSESFVPTALTQNIMPVYSFNNIGGTGLPETDHSTDKDTGSIDDNTNDNTDEPVEAPEQAGYKKLTEVFTQAISNAADGTTVTFQKEDGISTLSAAMMKTLADKQTVSLHLEYTYDDIDYAVTIPAGSAALEEGIWWYGPLWLNAHYGK